MGNKVGSQGPGRIDVAKCLHHVGDVGTHHPLVGPLAGEIDRLAIDGKFGVAQYHQIQPGRRYDNVRIQTLAGLQHDSRFIDVVYVVRHHARTTRFERLKKVIIGHKTQPLVPGVVMGGKVLFHIQNAIQFLPHFFQQHAAQDAGRNPGQTIEKLLPDRIAPTGDRIRDLVRQVATQPVGTGIHRRAGNDIGGGALQHGHLGRRLRHIGHQGHGRRAGPDHHHVFVFVVQVRRPELGVYPGSAE